MRKATKPYIWPCAENHAFAFSRSLSKKQKTGIRVPGCDRLYKIWSTLNLPKLAPHAHGPRYATSLTRPTRTRQRGSRRAKQNQKTGKRAAKQNEKNQRRQANGGGRRTHKPRAQSKNPTKPFTGTLRAERTKAKVVSQSPTTNPFATQFRKTNRNARTHYEGSQHACAKPWKNAWWSNI
jgi:hypothetical protein